MRRFLILILLLAGAVLLTPNGPLSAQTSNDENRQLLEQPIEKMNFFSFSEWIGAERKLRIPLFWEYPAPQVFGNQFNRYPSTDPPFVDSQGAPQDKEGFSLCIPMRGFARRYQIRGFVKVEPTFAYRISGWIKRSQDLKRTTPKIGIEWYDEKRNKLRATPDYCLSAVSPDKKDMGPKKVAPEQWTEVETIVHDIPNAAWAKIVCVLEPEPGLTEREMDIRGEAWFDSIRIERRPRIAFGSKDDKPRKIFFGKEDITLAFHYEGLSIEDAAGKSYYRTFDCYNALGKPLIPGEKKKLDNIVNNTYTNDRLTLQNADAFGAYYIYVRILREEECIADKMISVARVNPWTFKPALSDFGLELSELPAGDLSALATTLRDLSFSTMKMPFWTENFDYTDQSQNKRIRDFISNYRQAKQDVNVVGVFGQVPLPLRKKTRLDTLAALLSADTPDKQNEWKAFARGVTAQVESEQAKTVYGIGAADIIDMWQLGGPVDQSLSERGKAPLIKKFFDATSDMMSKTKTLFGADVFWSQETNVPDPDSFYRDAQPPVSDVPKVKFVTLRLDPRLAGEKDEDVNDATAQLKQLYSRSIEDYQLAGSLTEKKEEPKDNTNTVASEEMKRWFMIPPVESTRKGGDLNSRIVDESNQAIQLAKNFVLSYRLKNIDFTKPLTGTNRTATAKPRISKILFGQVIAGDGGLLDNDFSPRPAFVVLRHLAQVFNGAEFLELDSIPNLHIFDTEVPDNWILHKNFIENYLFIKKTPEGQDCFMVIWTTDPNRTAVLDVALSPKKGVKVIDIFGNPRKVKELERVLTPKEGGAGIKSHRVLIPVGPEPVIVTGIDADLIRTHLSVRIPTPIYTTDIKQTFKILFNNYLPEKAAPHGTITPVFRDTAWTPFPGSTAFFRPLDKKVGDEVSAEFDIRVPGNAESQMDSGAGDIPLDVFLAISTNRGENVLRIPVMLKLTSPITVKYNISTNINLNEKNLSPEEMENKYYQIVLSLSYDNTKTFIKTPPAELKRVRVNFSLPALEFSKIATIDVLKANLPKHLTFSFPPDKVMRLLNPDLVRKNKEELAKKIKNKSAQNLAQVDPYKIYLKIKDSTGELFLNTSLPLSENPTSPEQ